MVANAGELDLPTHMPDVFVLLNKGFPADLDALGRIDVLMIMIDGGYSLPA